MSAFTLLLTPSNSKYFIPQTEKLTIESMYAYHPDLNNGEEPEASLALFCPLAHMVLTVIALRAVSGPKCQLNRPYYIPGDKVVMGGSAQRHRCAPLSARVSFTPACLTALYECQRGRAQVFLLRTCDCAPTPAAEAAGHRQVQVPPKQTSCINRLLDMCVRVRTQAYEKSRLSLCALFSYHLH